MIKRYEKVQYTLELDSLPNIRKTVLDETAPLK